jgi:hypothetical protein
MNKEEIIMTDWYWIAGRWDEEKKEWIFLTRGGQEINTIKIDSISLYTQAGYVENFLAKENLHTKYYPVKIIVSNVYSVDANNHKKIKKPFTF